MLSGFYNSPAHEVGRDNRAAYATQGLQKNQTPNYGWLNSAGMSGIVGAQPKPVDPYPVKPAQPYWNGKPAIVHAGNDLPVDWGFSRPIDTGSIPPMRGDMPGPWQHLINAKPAAPTYHFTPVTPKTVAGPTNSLLNARTF